MNRKQVRMLRVIDGDTIEVLVRRGPFRQARKDHYPHLAPGWRGVFTNKSNLDFNFLP